MGAGMFRMCFSLFHRAFSTQHLLLSYSFPVQFYRSELKCAASIFEVSQAFAVRLRCAEEKSINHFDGFEDRCSRSSVGFRINSFSVLFCLPFPPGFDTRCSRASSLRLQTTCVPCVALSNTIFIF